MSSNNSPRPSSKRPLIPVNRHMGRTNHQLMIYVCLRRDEKEVRIYFEKEEVPHHLYSQMRTVRLQKLKPDQDIYVFRPWTGIEILVNSEDETFFVKAGTEEYAAVRDEHMKLILK